MVGKNLTGWIQPVRYGQWLCVQVQAGDRWCPLGSVFGPVLFNIITNNTDREIECTFSRFAGDPKLNGALVEGKDVIQRQLDKLEKWACGNFMKFKKSNCDELHLVQGNSRYEHRLGKELIGSSSVKKDFRDLMDEMLNMSQQHARQHANPRKPTSSWNPSRD